MCKKKSNQIPDGDQGAVQSLVDSTWNVINIYICIWRGYWGLIHSFFRGIWDRLWKYFFKPTATSSYIIYESVRYYFKLICGFCDHVASSKPIRLFFLHRHIRALIFFSIYVCTTKIAGIDLLRFANFAIRSRLSKEISCILCFLQIFKFDRDYVNFSRLCKQKEKRNSDEYETLISKRGDASGEWWCKCCGLRIHGSHDGCAMNVFRHPLCRFVKNSFFAGVFFVFL